MGPIIIPMDGFESKAQLLHALEEILQDPVANALIGYIKLNDAVHMKLTSGPTLIEEIRYVLEKNGSTAKIFLDLKLADTNGTNVNILKHYVEQPPDILTVRDCCSSDGFLKLRKLLPDTNIALVSALTDMPVEECRRRYGMMPALKILNDITNIEICYAAIRESGDPLEPFDMIVCSPLEVEILANLFPYKFRLIVPGIRDPWMLKGQQKRTTGVREALNLGANFVVMGSQMTKGNPSADISAEKSRKMTMEEIEKSNFVEIIPEDPIATLVNCSGYYVSPVDNDGNFVGPLVGYAGTYDDRDGNKKNYVGSCYFNVASAEPNPRTLNYFASLVAEIIKGKIGVPDVVLGAPMGGILLAEAIGVRLPCRISFAEKKVTRLAVPEDGLKEESMLIIKRHEIKSGDKVVVIEDLCNNFSTTDKLKALIESKGGKMVAVACVINRSEKTDWNKLPVISVIHKPTPQYKQDDPKVIELVKAGNIVWKPKYEWDKLKKAMMEKR